MNCYFVGITNCFGPRLYGLNPISSEDLWSCTRFMIVELATAPQLNTPAHDAGTPSRNGSR